MYPYEYQNANTIILISYLDDPFFFLVEKFHKDPFEQNVVAIDFHPYKQYQMVVATK